VQQHSKETHRPKVGRGCRSSARSAHCLRRHQAAPRAVCVRTPCTARLDRRPGPRWGSSEAGAPAWQVSTQRLMRSVRRLTPHPARGAGSIRVLPGHSSVLPRTARPLPFRRSRGGPTRHRQVHPPIGSRVLPDVHSSACGDHPTRGSERAMRPGQEPTCSTSDPTSAISHASAILPSWRWQMTA
jgi:hypothetical protein